MSKKNTELFSLPLLPLRDVVVFPKVVVPLFVGRDKSIQALESAMLADKQIVLVAQKDPSNDSPEPEDIYSVGTLANILQLMRLPDGTVKVLIEGESRVSINNAYFGDAFFSADVTVKHDILTQSKDFTSLSTLLISQLEKLSKQSKKISSEVITSVKEIDSPSYLADTVVNHLNLPIKKRQEALEQLDVAKRLDQLILVVDSETDLLLVESKIRGRVKKQMEKSQREYYLNEQMKAIQKELGDMDESPSEIEQFHKKIIETGMPNDAFNKANAELNKLKMMSPMSAEASVLRTYLDWITSIPWKKRSRVRYDIPHAEKILNKDHYGLEEVKDRILEYLAVQKRVKKIKGSILCLMGPPGVGKTSLGESIARATNRKFLRISLGGVRDEAEIRGHRRTYIGSMPGKIIQKIAKVGVKNPLILLDEIDKMGMDHRGDPASALLEVLDPEQNNTFSDHYLECDYDLSEVLFICTANSLNIPSPLLDRMEVIRIPGYTEDEKLHIANQYLLPKQLKNHGLLASELLMDKQIILDVIRFYTKEAGVRGLERELAKLARKSVKQLMISDKKEKTINIGISNLPDFLGVKKYDFGIVNASNQIGLVTGLAWTQVGGELLNIEAAVVPGKGLHVKTGSLGDVMQESIQAAITVVKSRSQKLGIPASYFQNYDLHIHMPEGATPKDGPSAGIGMSTAMVSVLTGIPVRADVAMTGEITLRGQVLRIGGLKEKLLAAHRGGVKTVIIPKENKRDLAEIPAKILDDLDIQFAEWIEEVFAIALESMPREISDEEYLADFEKEKYKRLVSKEIQTRPH